MPRDDKNAVEREIRIAAEPETVFEFLTDPVKMVRWKGREAQLEPRPGGVYRVDVNGRDVARGNYLEIVPYSRVVFSWGWEGAGSTLPPGASTVEILLIPDGDGTIVRLKHRDLPSPESVQQHSAGWDLYLPRLAAAAAGADR